MARRSAFNYLTPEQNAAADACIRQYRYARLDEIVEALEAQGIVMTRSAVGRYMKKLRERDGMLMDATDATVVTIVDRASGNVIVLKTALGGSELASRIQAFVSAADVS